MSVRRESRGNHRELAPYCAQAQRPPANRNRCGRRNRPRGIGSISRTSIRNIGRSGGGGGSESGGGGRSVEIVVEVATA